MIAPPRVTLSEKTTTLLRQLAARTGLSPNILARFAMIVSLEQSHPPAEDVGETGLTINRNTLFGELEPFLLSQLAARTSPMSEKKLPKVIADHICRGTGYLLRRIHSVVDLAELSISDIP